MAKIKTVVVLPGIHCCEHDQKALDCALRAVKRIKPDEVVLLGDVIDGGVFSSHPAKGFEQNDMAHDYIESEVNPTLKLLKYLEKYTRHIVYLEGNHEQRVERWALGQGGLGLYLYRSVSPRKIFSKGRKNFTWIPYRAKDIQSHYAITPDLWAIHGWSFSKHAASTHMNIARSVSIVHGHTHRMQAYASRDPATGRIIKAWSPGCLSKLQPLYKLESPTEWNHGFSIIYIDGKQWTDYTVTIHKGSCILPDGRKI